MSELQKEKKPQGNGYTQFISKPYKRGYVIKLVRTPRGKRRLLKPKLGKANKDLALAS